MAYSAVRVVLENTATLLQNHFILAQIQRERERERFSCGFIMG